MALAQELHDDDMVLLLLDIEKAFDSVFWDFLSMVLWGFGFPQDFVDWIHLTHQNVSIKVLNNGYLSESIEPTRGLAQGCGLSPFLFILTVEGLATLVRRDSRIPSITVDGACKKIAQVADDTLLSFRGSAQVINRVKSVLVHFSDISGLKLNYDKSSLIALGSHLPEWFSEPCVNDFKKIHISDGFDYLGLTHSASAKIVQENFPLSPNLLNRITDKQVHRKLSLSGRILQVKQLLASTFVYWFQLLPSTRKEFMQQVDKMLHNYVWDNSRHRLHKSLLFQPTVEGGLGMVNIHVHNTALKFAWFNRLLSDRANLQFWSVRLGHCFILPLCDVLNCNLHHGHLDVVCKPDTLLPPYWVEVFTKWFQQFFISEGCTDSDSKKKVLTLPVVFNSEMTRDTVWKSPQLYDTLKEHDVLLLKPFLVNFVTIFSMIKTVDPEMATMIAQLRTVVPHTWNNLVTQSMDSNIPPPCVITDRLSAGLLTPKVFTQMLLPRDKNYQVLAKWENDLGCDIEHFLWDEILKKSKLLFIPSLKDFHAQFLHRGFHYNLLLATYIPARSPLCTFCGLSSEMYMHLFWDCKYSAPLWTALQTISYDKVDM